MPAERNHTTWLADRNPARAILATRCVYAWRCKPCKVPQANGGARRAAADATRSITQMKHCLSATRNLKFSQKQCNCISRKRSRLGPLVSRTVAWSRRRRQAPAYTSGQRTAWRSCGCRPRPPDKSAGFIAGNFRIRQRLAPPLHIREIPSRTQFRCLSQNSFTRRPERRISSKEGRFRKTFQCDSFK